MDYFQVDFRGLDRESKQEMLNTLLEQNVHAHTADLPTEAQMRKALGLGVEPTEIIEMSRTAVSNEIARINGSYDQHVTELSGLTGTPEEEVRAQYPNATPLWKAVEKEKRKHS